MPSPQTIRDCLAALSDNFDFAPCDSLEQEFQVIRSAHRKQILVCHPDKGGTAESFRAVQAAFNVLKELYQKKSIDSFATHLNDDASQNYHESFQDANDMPVPPWDFYEEAPEENVPGYRVEPAKSGRSKCKQKGRAAKKCEQPYIEKGTVSFADDTVDTIYILLLTSFPGAIRVGSLEKEAGSYTRWNHLDCWRVPSSIWLGFPPELDVNSVRKALFSMNSVLISGIDELNEADLQRFIAHVLHKSHWAKRINRRAPETNKSASKSVPEDSTSSPANAPASTTRASIPSNELVVTGQQLSRGRRVFVPPRPGVNGALVDALAGKRVVLTGLFPEVGGGMGLNLGKDRAKQIVDSFGGRVTSAVSGKTDYLLVGREPGASKVTQARERGIQMLTIGDLKEGLEGNCLEAMKTTKKPLAITSYSSGYKGRALLKPAPAEPEEEPSSHKPKSKKRQRTKK